MTKLLKNKTIVLCKSYVIQKSRYIKKLNDGGKVRHGVNYVRIVQS